VLHRTLGARTTAIAWSLDGTPPHEGAAWQDRRNASATPVDWRFTTADARIKLKRLYPSLEE
jgi:hypothetical protein